MIQVIITGPATGTGFIPYVIDWYRHGRHQFVGLSPTPLLDACRQLKQFGLMDDTVVGLFNRDDHRWIERTTVGYGARTMAPYREFPGGPVKEIQDRTHPAVAAVLNGEQPEQSEGPPPPPHTPREPPNDKGRAHAKPKTSGHSHPKRRRAKSGARQGQR